LITRIEIVHLQVGYDFRIGKNRNGDFSTLLKLGEEFGFSVGQSSPIEDQGGIISSSRIRFLLGVGQVEEAAKLLGRNYKIQGIIEVGDQRGRKLGFPTANIAVWAERLIPTAGVYACWATVRGKTWGAISNVGVRPTFETSPVPPRVEAHLLDFNDDIYGENLQLEFVSRLRDERRFPSIDSLIAQISQDSLRAREILSA
jgi:riboflavin kinase/FMN adenylyltransferase